VEEASRSGIDGLERAVSAFERHFILRALERTGWNRKAAAQRLGIAYSTMKKKLKSHGLAPDEDEAD
jgi:two-component system response regulator PilR (NtrC family)